MAPHQEFPNRMAKYRAKLKEDKVKYEEHLEKERKRLKNIRADQKSKQKTDKTFDDSVKARKRMQMRNYRQKLKNKVDTFDKEPPLGSYSCTATFRKAVKKSLNNLPNSPSKKRAVVKQLVKETFPKFKILPRSSRQNLLLEDKVVEFYQSDGISWQAPGKRDFVSVKDKEGKKVHIQKRYMHMTVEEALEVFRKKYKDENIGKSKFYSLRPKNVIPMSGTPHTVCVCVTHANFIYAVDTLSRYCVDKQTHSSLMESICCDVKSEKCMTNRCTECQYNVMNLVQPDQNLSQEITLKKWEKTDGVLNVSGKKITLGELVKEVNNMIPSFKTHSFVKGQQLEFFDTKKDNLAAGEAIVQVDFAENYSLIMQDEIQSAHWQHAQTTLFTCCIWLANNLTKSYVVVSNDLTHSKESAWLFLKAIIADVQRNTFLEKITMFSDNCAAQFKSKYTLCNMLYLAEDFKNVEWATFAAGHGKGSVDGIGGMVKRAVWLLVKSRSKLVTTPKEFYECALDAVKKIKVLYIEKDDVQETYQHLLMERWQNVNPIPGIQKIHYFKRSSDNQLLVGLTATTSKLETFTVKTCDPKVGRLHYEDVYSDSDPDDLDVDDCNDNNNSVVQNIVNSSDIKPRVFVCVALKSRARILEYKAICQTGLDTEDEVRVIFLMNFGSDPNSYIVNENDEKYVRIDQIKMVLNNPLIVSQNHRVLYKFST